MKMIKTLTTHKYSNIFASSLDKALPVFDTSDDLKGWFLLQLSL